MKHRFFGLALLFVLCWPLADVWAQRSGHFDWKGWSFDYEVSDLYDGVSLKEVTRNGTKILEKASFPVMRVFYENDDCGPYADRLGGTLAPVSWADDAEVVTREVVIEGMSWLEIGIRDLIGNYDLYQVWYLGENGVIDAHIFGRGLQCNVDHDHLPYWRLDFDVAGAGDDQILYETASGWTVHSNEFDAPANSAVNHGWQVRDAVTGDAVRIVFDNGVGNVPGEVIPETEFINNNVFGRRYRGSEDGGWTHGPNSEVPYNDGESLDADLVLWYSGYLPHGWREGAELWHSTGIRLFVNPTVLVQHPGDQTSGVGESVSLAIGLADAVYTATGLPPGLNINPSTGLISGVVTTVGAFSVVVNAEAGGDSEQITFSWEVTPQIACEAVASLDVPKTIGPDGGSITRSVLEMPELAALLDLQVIDLQGAHTYMGDLSFVLQSPSGTSVEIMERACGSDNDFSLSFDDDAAAYRPCPPADGRTYKPDNPLAAFDGEEPGGTWTLTVTDHANQDGGALNSWGLYACYEADPGEPAEPVTLVLGDLNLGVAAHDSRTGPGYIMYSQESVHERFAGAPPSAWAANHLIAVVFANGQWTYDRNKSELVAFSPRPNDHLLAEIDFGANTVNLLQGVDTAVEGVAAGFISGDLAITPEMWGGSPDAGEFWVQGTSVDVAGTGGNGAPVLAAIGDQANNIDEPLSLILSASDPEGDSVSFSAEGLPAGLNLSGSQITGTPTSAGQFNTTVIVSDGNGGSDSETFAWTIDGGNPSETITLELGNLNLGIAAHDQRTGTGYVMYSATSVHTRFADNPPSTWAADHLIAVVFDGGQWKIDRNKYTLVPFTPLSSDHLLVELDFGANLVTHLEGVNTSIEGINAGYESGDLVVTAEMWGGSPNEGEFGVEGASVEITGEAAQAISPESNPGPSSEHLFELPDTFDLASIYPNPFSLNTTIEYQLPEESPVKIELFSITGQRVRVLLDNGRMPAGRWRTLWDGRDEIGRVSAAGVYMIRFTAGGFIKTGKVVLIH